MKQGQTYTPKAGGSRVIKPQPQKKETSDGKAD